MTVQELIDRLTELETPDAELRFAYQPGYPLQDTLRGIWTDSEATFPAKVVYIVSSGQDHDQPYAPATAFSEAWS